jgi:hypothetical protein
MTILLRFRDIPLLRHHTPFRYFAKSLDKIGVRFDYR